MLDLPQDESLNDNYAYIFVADQSGSMDGTKQQLLIGALKALASSIPQNSQFQIM